MNRSVLGWAHGLSVTFLIIAGACGTSANENPGDDAGAGRRSRSQVPSNGGEPVGASGSASGGTDEAGSGNLQFLGPPISRSKVSPPLSGGTLVVLNDGRTAVASDPDRDKIFVVDLQKEQLLATVPLNNGDEPGRLVQDATGRVHVALRRGGSIATVKPGTWELVARRPVCTVPRGIAYDPSTDVLHVACAGGELVTLPSGGGPAIRTLTLERDLRDVVVNDGRLYVSKFRSAELMVISPEGKLLEKRQPPGSEISRQMLSLADGPRQAATPSVAWRLQSMPGGGVLMLHQEASNEDLRLQQQGYGGGNCRAGAVAPAMTRFFTNDPPVTVGQFTQFPLAIDLAVSQDGQHLAVVSAGNTASIVTTSQIALMVTDRVEQDGPCIFPSSSLPQSTPQQAPIQARAPAGQPVSIAFDGLGRVVVQTREPARIEVLTHNGGSIRLSDESSSDTGHAIFHAATSAGLACASCHPEGGDDGHVWHFEKLGLRRTQNLRGGILQTAPLHWDGEMHDLGQLMGEVFSKRMGGPTLTAEQLDALAQWLDRIPALPTVASADPAPVMRGRALFSDGSIGCANCHAGPLFTNNQSVDVGTGQAFQVPSLRGVVWRAPYMHDGCAATLADRFNAKCGGNGHGNTSQLTSQNLSDLTAYLESL